MNTMSTTYRNTSNVTPMGMGETPLSTPTRRHQRTTLSTSKQQQPNVGVVIGVSLLTVGLIGGGIGLAMWASNRQNNKNRNGDTRSDKRMSVLQANNWLRAGDILESQNGQYTFTQTPEGTLVLRDTKTNTNVWHNAFTTTPKPNTTLRTQLTNNADLVTLHVTDDEQTSTFAWHTNTAKQHPGQNLRLTLSNDGDVMVRNDQGTTLWTLKQDVRIGTWY